MGLLMIGHLLGDFYILTDKMEEKKKESLWHIGVHCLIYIIVMYVVLTMFIAKPIEIIFPMIIIGVSHFVVEGIKYLIYKNDKLKKYELSFFITEQLIHVLILFFISVNGTVKFEGIWWNFTNKVYNVPIVLITFLFCGKPAGKIISLIFGLIPQTIEAAKKDNEAEGETEKNGVWIGMLEREIILILGLLGEYGAIGFVVAAKSLARHSQFDKNSAFAEKYLIGTLLSSMFALISIIMCSVL